MYWTHLGLDYVFILLQWVGITAVFWYATNKFTWTRYRLRWLAWLVVLFSLIDAIENLLIASALSSYPTIGTNQIARIRMITEFKQYGLLLILLVLVISVVLLISAFIRWLRPSKGNL